MQRNTNKPLTYLEDVLKEALRKSKYDPQKYLTYDKALEAVKLMFEYIVFETGQEEVDAAEHEHDPPDKGRATSPHRRQRSARRWRNV